MLCIQAGIAKGSVECMCLDMIKPMQPAYKNLHDPLRAAAIPGCLLNGIIAPPLPAPKQNVPPMPIMTIGNTNPYRVSP